MWKRHGFFDQWNYAEKSTWRRREFFDPRNYIEKVEMKFGLRCIEVISTSNRCGLHLVCLLSSHILFHLFCLYFLRMHHNYFFRRGFEGLRAQFQEAATRCCFVKKVFCVTSWCWHFNRFPSFRQNDQNARAVVFRQRFIIPFKKQVNFQANT